MKLWMLGNRLTTEMYERQRFIEEAEKQNIDFSVVFADEIGSNPASVVDAVAWLPLEPMSAKPVPVVKSMCNALFAND